MVFIRDIKKKKKGWKLSMTDGELKLQFVSMHEKLDNIADKVADTNGRVQSLERWRMFIMGGLTILTLLFVPVMFLLLRQWLISPH